MNIFEFNDDSKNVSLLSNDNGELMSDFSGNIIEEVDGLVEKVDNDYINRECLSKTVDIK